MQGVNRNDEIVISPKRYWAHHHHLSSSLYCRIQSEPTFPPTPLSLLNNSTTALRRRRRWSPLSFRCVEQDPAFHSMVSRVRHIYIHTHILQRTLSLPHIAYLCRTSVHGLKIELLRLSFFHIYISLRVLCTVVQPNSRVPRCWMDLVRSSCKTRSNVPPVVQRKWDNMKQKQEE